MRLHHPADSRLTYSRHQATRVVRGALHAALLPCTLPTSGSSDSRVMDGISSQSVGPISLLSSGGWADSRSTDWVWLTKVWLVLVQKIAAKKEHLPRDFVDKCSESLEPIHRCVKSQPRRPEKCRRVLVWFDSSGSTF